MKIKRKGKYIHYYSGSMEIECGNCQSLLEVTFDDIDCRNGKPFVTCTFCGCNNYSIEKLWIVDTTKHPFITSSKPLA